MDSYVVLIATAVACALVGGGGAGGLFSFSFGSHKKADHPAEIWRTANRRAGLSLVLYSAIVAICAIIARSQTPDLDMTLGVALTIFMIVPVAGIGSAMKVLGQSKREQRKGQLLR